MLSPVATMHLANDGQALYVLAAGVSNGVSFEGWGEGTE